MNTTPLQVPGLRALTLALVCAGALALGACATPAAFEPELHFSARDLQDAIDKAPQKTSVAEGAVVVSLLGSPVLQLGEPPQRVGFSTNLGVQVLGSRVLPLQVRGSAKVVYREAEKSFYLDEPVVDSVRAAFIPSALESAAGLATTRLLANTFRATPIYTLREDRSLKERAAATFLKSIDIRKDAIVARFGWR